MLWQQTDRLSLVYLSLRRSLLLFTLRWIKGFLKVSWLVLLEAVWVEGVLMKVRLIIYDLQRE